MLLKRKTKHIHKKKKIQQNSFEFRSRRSTERTNERLKREQVSPQGLKITFCFPFISFGKMFEKCNYLRAHNQSTLNV